MRENSLKIIECVCAMLGGEQDTSKILSQLCKYLVKVFQVKAIAICTFDTQDNRMNVRASHGLYIDELQTFLPVGGLTEQAFREGRPANTILRRGEQNAIAPSASGLLQRCNSVIVTPLRINGRPIGTLTLCRQARQIFPKWIVETCNVLSTPLASFLQSRDAVRRQMNDCDNSNLAYNDMPTGKSCIAIDGSVSGRHFGGKSIVSGCGLGKVMLLAGDTSLIEAALVHTNDSVLQGRRLNEAYEITRASLMKCSEEIGKVIAEADASIFDMHLTLLDDPTLRERIESFLSDGYTLEAALSLTFKAFENDFNEIEDEYLRERLQDIEDILLRLLNAACNNVNNNAIERGEPVVLVARELFPSQLFSQPFQQISGILCETGGPTSHAAILARALRIPMVVNIPEIQRHVHPGDSILVDGSSGLCLINPAESTVHKYRPAIESTTDVRNFRKNEQIPPIDDTPQTLDGVSVHLCGNVTLTSEINALHAVGIQEIGLYRTEFMFMIRNSMPDEQTQFSVLSHLIEHAKGAPVTIRALDIGGDKPLPYIKWAPELNPSLGWRGLRFLLSNPDITRPHLRAILRACTTPNAQLMFPMVADKGDLMRAKAAVADAMASLDTDRIPHGSPKIGMMLEVPSAITCLDQLMPIVDFVSIGTNDLIQYLFAVDRGNSLVTQWFNACHPVVFRLLGVICEKMKRFPDKELEICGELAGQTLALPAILGSGLRKLSMNCAVIPQIRNYIKRIALSDCQELYTSVCECDTPAEARMLLEDFRKTHG